MMSTKEELHHLVDQLGDEQVPEVLTYLRRLLHEEDASGRTATADLAQRMGPRAVSGQALTGAFARVEARSQLVVPGTRRPPLVPG
jgi:hypothetical protein